MNDPDVVRCEHCGTAVHAGSFWQPLKYVERAADADAPRSFLIIGRERLMHRCLIGDDTP
jgi:hypothetical protein